MRGFDFRNEKLGLSFKPNCRAGSNSLVRWFAEEGHAGWEATVKFCEDERWGEAGPLVGWDERSQRSIR